MAWRNSCFREEELSGKPSIFLSYGITFLGRMCLPDEIDRLTEAQWKIVRDANNSAVQALLLVSRTGN